MLLGLFLILVLASSGQTSPWFSVLKRFPGFWDLLTPPLLVPWNHRWSYNLLILLIPMLLQNHPHFSPQLFHGLFRLFCVLIQAWYIYSRDKKLISKMVVTHSNEKLWIPLWVNHELKEESNISYPNVFFKIIKFCNYNSSPYVL